MKIRETRMLVQALMLVVISGTLAQAQQKPVSLASVLDQQLTAVEHDFVSAAEAMPEDKYSFAPSAGDFKDVRTFMLQVRHVAYVNHLFFAAVLGEKLPLDIGRNGPELLRSKSEIMQYLRESFALAHRAIATITPANVVAVIPNPPRPQFNTRLEIVTRACDHTYDHYGQMVEYLRMNGIVPPASRPQPN